MNVPTNGRIEKDILERLSRIVSQAERKLGKKRESSVKSFWDRTGGPGVVEGENFSTVARLAKEISLLRQKRVQ